MQTPVPDVGACVAVATTPHTELETIPPSKVDSDGHVFSGGSPHYQLWSTDTCFVVDSPQLIVPGNDISSSKVDQNKINQPWSTTWDNIT